MPGARASSSPSSSRPCCRYARAHTCIISFTARHFLHRMGQQLRNGFLYVFGRVVSSSHLLALSVFLPCCRSSHICHVFPWPKYCVFDVLSDIAYLSGSFPPQSAHLPFSAHYLTSRRSYRVSSSPKRRWACSPRPIRPAHSITRVSCAHSSHCRSSFSASR